MLLCSVDRILAGAPHNAYNLAERPLTLSIIDKVASVPYGLAHDALRHAVGLPPSQSVIHACEWLRNLAASPSLRPLIGRHCESSVVCAGTVGASAESDVCMALCVIEAGLVVFHHLPPGPK